MSLWNLHPFHRRGSCANGYPELANTFPSSRLSISHSIRKTSLFVAPKLVCNGIVWLDVEYERVSRSNCKVDIRVQQKGPLLEAYTTSGFGAKWRSYSKNVNVLCGEDAAKFHSDQVDAGENAVVLSELKAES